MQSSSLSRHGKGTLNRKRRSTPSTNTEMMTDDGPKLCSDKIRGKNINSGALLDCLHGQWAVTRRVFAADITASVRRSDAHSTITSQCAGRCFIGCRGRAGSQQDRFQGGSVHSATQKEFNVTPEL